MSHDCLHKHSLPIVTQSHVTLQIMCFTAPTLKRLTNKTIPNILSNNYTNTTARTLKEVSLLILLF